MHFVIYKFLTIGSWTLAAREASPVGPAFESVSAISVVTATRRERRPFIRGGLRPNRELEIDGHVGTPATLSLFDVGRTTKCILFIDTGKKGTMFDFDLDKVADRRGFDHRGGGTVLRLGVDRFNQGKLIGPAGGPPKKTEIGEDPAHTLF